MKVINKAIETQMEKQEQERINNEKYQAEQKAKKEKQVPTIKIIMDWRLIQEYKKYLSNKRIMEWPHNAVELKRNYFEQAIENRGKLNNIVIEDYEQPLPTIQNIVEIETDYATIEVLRQEANMLGLSMDVYVRGIFYTAAYEVNQQAEKEDAAWKAYVEESTPFRIGEGFISQKLKRKLEGSKYNHPENSNRLYGIPESIYTDMLIELANEYFEIK